MPDRPVTVTITINGTGCTPDPEPFVTTRNSIVTFLVVPAETPNTRIKFTNGPFDNDDLPPGPHKVKGDAAQTEHPYKVTWPGGQGGGTGEITPG